MTTRSTDSYLIHAGETTIGVIGEIGPIRNIDGYYSEEHEFNVRTTDYPVESGATLTDHAQRQPYRLKLSGIASEVLRGPRAAADAWAEILRHVEARRPVTVITRLGSYNNMLVVSGKAPIDSTTGLSLVVDLELKEVITATIVRSAVSALPAPTSGPAQDRQSPASRGRVTAPQTPNPEASQVTVGLSGAGSK